MAGRRARLLLALCALALCLSAPPGAPALCLRLRGGDAAAAAAALPARRARAAIHVPADVGDVDEAIEMVPGAGSTIEFDVSRRHVLDEVAIVRWGMRMRLVGGRAAGARGRPAVAQRAEVWGNWTLLQRTMGEWEDLKLGLHCYTSACALLDIRGGPWAFSHCDARCIGGVAVQLVLSAKLIMTRCAVGGIDTQHMRAQDGLVCRMDSCADLEDCTLEMCGVLTGYGVHLLEVLVAARARQRLHARAHARVHASACIHTRTRTHAHTRTRARAHMRIRTHTYAHARTRTRTRTRAHAHTRRTLARGCSTAEC
jgi:hypothetical protein